MDQSRVVSGQLPNTLETLLPWDKFAEWLHCMCVVTFDLELGQAMEVMSSLMNCITL